MRLISAFASPGPGGSIAGNAIRCQQPAGNGDAYRWCRSLVPGTRRTRRDKYRRAPQPGCGAAGDPRDVCAAAL
jgi:hypothetical protein